LVAPSFRSAAADAGSGVVKEEATIEAVANPDMKTFDTSEKPLKYLPKPTLSALSFDAWIISKDGIDEVLILVSGTKDATVGSMNAI